MKKVKKTQKNYARNRIVVFRSNQHIYAQIIDDAKGATLVSVSDYELGSSKGKKSSKKADGQTEENADTKKMNQARLVGKLLAEKAQKQKVGKTYFDRRGYKYHGRIKALAEGAREAGLDF
ncbi:MAG: 50S ribosomal protein L18 [Candidatus Roizmanbacteria bacterium]|nr:50S ribosomal protein L18 [Candidatus Roizmanbacteria bacterium]